MERAKRKGPGRESTGPSPRHHMKAPPSHVQHAMYTCTPKVCVGGRGSILQGRASLHAAVNHLGSRTATARGCLARILGSCCGSGILRPRPMPQACSSGTRCEQRQLQNWFLCTTTLSTSLRYRSHHAAGEQICQKRGTHMHWSRPGRCRQMSAAEHVLTHPWVGIPQAFVRRR